MHSKTFKIQISGRVQGVGFRPFVFNLAKKNHLLGTVSNNENGVIIYINTSEEKAVHFVEQILKEKPEVSIITAHSIEEVKYEEYTDFSIIPSESDEKINIPLTPDFAVCNACKTEISNKNNRRFQYAFTTCIHCGPRYAVTKKYPFERKNTSLHTFKMCANCLDEYKNPLNKRFHSQTNSCKDCGITMELLDNKKVEIENNQTHILDKLVTLLHKGKIIALKNTNGYLLCCDASNPNAITNLRKRKNRFNKPFAVLYPTIDFIKNDFDISSEEENALVSIIAPIVILKNTKQLSFEPNNIAPNLNYTGVMLPSSALLQLIAKKAKKPIIATSGNAHGSPIITTKEEAELKLNTIADYFLHHNLDIEFPQDDSVLKFVDKQQVLIRRSRGLSPNFEYAEKLTKNKILAMGSHLKSTFTYLPNKHIYLSPYFGNLDNYDVLNRFTTTIDKYIELFNTKPKTILTDKHLHYQSSILGKAYREKWNANLIEIQHHKAHFCSVLAEHKLFQSTKKILGVIWDGTGFGDDNQIWGGEFFSYENNKIDRINHFEYFNWIANDKMAKEPRLSLFSLIDDEDKELIKGKFTKTEYKIYNKMLKNNTLKTSSVGRLFDAVASALDIVDVNSYEAEAAMLLENCANSSQVENCIDLLEFKDYDTIPSKLLLKIIIKAYKIDGVSKAFIARSFIFTLAKIIIKIAKKNKVKTIVCSGGVFQNSVLIKILTELSIEKSLDLKFNCKLSANDENISFGQLMYYQNIKN
ncbi:MAG: carbamoyltransferase HypF [Flavobacteriaceae bacterium]|nr:carbamoyltransferase HypF [Flavobacteriaceae bacterium]